MISKSLPATYDDVIAVVDLLFRWAVDWGVHGASLVRAA